MERYGRAVRATPSQWPYYRFTQDVYDIAGDLRRRGGIPLVAAFHRYVVLRQVPESWATLRTPHLAPALPWFEDAVELMLDDLHTLPDADLDLGADPFVKDLAVASLRLWALGAVTVEFSLKLPLRWIVQGGAGPLLSGIHALARLGGRYPLYEMHAYIRHYPEFNEPGWEAMYRRMAELMKADSEVRGLYGGTWFWDPGLATVSPNLAYLRRLPLNNGAIFARIPSTPDTFANALYKSGRRREMYEAGTYEPRQFIMVWPRQAFLKWAGLG